MRLTLAHSLHNNIPRRPPVVAAFLAAGKRFQGLCRFRLDPNSAERQGEAPGFTTKMERVPMLPMMTRPSEVEVRLSGKILSPGIEISVGTLVPLAALFAWWLTDHTYAATALI